MAPILINNEELTARIFLRQILMRKEKSKVKFRCDVNLTQFSGIPSLGGAD